MTSILWSAGTGLRILLVLLLVNTGQFLVGGRRQAIPCGNLRRNFRPYPNTRVVKSGNQLRVLCDAGYFIRDRGRRPRTQLVIKCNGGGTLQQPIPKCTDYSKCGHAYYTPRPVTTRARVVGGRPSKRSDWPWAVKLVIKDTYWCGGTIVSEEYIMTAAHCLQGVDHEDQIKISFEDKKNTTKIAKAYVIHPNYNNDLLKNDVAMIQYERLQRYNRNQQRICLPQIFNTNRFLTTSMLAIGWGTTKPVAKGFRGRKKDRSDQIKQVAIPLIDNRACAKNVQDKLDLGLQNWYFNSTKQFCAGDISGQNDTCHGDSGGPAMVYNREDKSWIQVGIISWGYGCAQKGEYGYYTKVSAFLDWIEKVVHVPTFKRVVRPPKKAKPCGYPGTPKNGKKHGRIYTFGSSVRYSCDPCYRLVGSRSRRCQVNSKWSNSIPKCVMQTCPPPNLPKNTKVVIPRNYKKSNDTQCGTRLTLGCESGYTLSMGQRGSLLCDVVGRWKNITPQECQPRACRDPGHVRNGNRKGLLFHYTSNVSFSCDPCYKLDGPPFRTCQANGKWSDTQPVCKMVKCSKPKTLVNGTEKFVSTDCRSSVVYSCYKGYKLAGSSKRVCGEDGKWTGQEPKCTIVSCGVPKDASLRRRVKIIGTNFHYAATVRFACADGDVIDGNKWAECLENGSWSHETPRCLASCKPPKGVLPEDVFLDREETKFTCPSGKKISGTINTKKVICNAGAWEYEDGKTVKVDEVRCIKEKKTAWNFLGR